MLQFVTLIFTLALTPRSIAAPVRFFFLVLVSSCWHAIKMVCMCVELVLRVKASTHKSFERRYFSQRMDYHSLGFSAEDLSSKRLSGNVSFRVGCWPGLAV